MGRDNSRFAYMLTAPILRPRLPAVSRQRLAGLLVVIALLLGGTGVGLWLSVRGSGPGVDRSLTPAQHAVKACDSFASALARIRGNGGGKKVFADLDRADREARAAVDADPIYAQLASAILLARQLIKDDATDGLDQALEMTNTQCSVVSG